MSDDRILRMRNIGIMAHIDAGKTTLTERILYYTNSSHRLGEVHEGTAVTDWMVQEQERGITITSAAVTCDWRDAIINIIDTPGHVDFTIEVERSLRVLDGAVAVLDGAHGVEPQTETVWRQADRHKVPRLCFVNKLDKAGADFNKSVQSLVDKLSAKPLLLQIPIGLGQEFTGVIDLVEMVSVVWDSNSDGAVERRSEIPDELLDAAKAERERMLEILADHDEETMALFLDGEEVPSELAKRVIRRLTIAQEVVPVFCGSAFKNKGVQPLLDGVVAYLPAPTDLGSVIGLSADDKEEEVARERTSSEPFSGLIFKIVNDSYVGLLSYLRVYSGGLKEGEVVFNSRTKKRERVQKILRMKANDRTPLQSVAAGDIVGVVGLKGIATGDTLCDQKAPIRYETVHFPDPVIFSAIEPKNSADAGKLENLLGRLTTEDPSLAVKTDGDTGQLLLGGMGELHIDIIIDRLDREFRIPVSVGAPQVAYRETISTSARVKKDFTREIPNKGTQFAEVEISIEPCSPSQDLVFESKISDPISKLKEAFVRKGLSEALLAGPIAGFAMLGIKATLHSLRYEQGNSEDVALQIAGSLALREAAQKAKARLLYPIMNLEVLVAEGQLSNVINDLNGRGAQVKNIDLDDTGIQHIKAEVALAEMFGYSTTLRSITQGRGSYSMTFDHYGLVPEKALAAIRGF